MDNQSIKANYELREMARNQLKGQWGTAILLILVFTAITYIPSFLPRSAAFIVNLIITGPLTLGLIACFMNLVRGESFQFEKLFDGFSNFSPALFTYLLTSLYILLWSILLVIPGFIAAYRYSMAFFILNDNPDMSASDSISASKDMMRGYKGKLFMLHLSFIGWAILSTLTLGIGFLWLFPYFQTSTAYFYENLKEAQTV